MLELASAFDPLFRKWLILFSRPIVTEILNEGDLLETELVQSGDELVYTLFEVDEPDLGLVAGLFHHAVMNDMVQDFELR